MAKPHAIMVEYLYQGHITPFVHLAVALASKGCTVTYIQTGYTHHLMSISNNFVFSGAIESGLDIRCTTISDGFPLDFDRGLNLVEFYGSIVRDFPARVDQLVARIVNEGGGGGGVRPFLVADALYEWPPAVAAKHGIVNVAFWTSTAIQLSINYHLRMINQENGLLETRGEYKDPLHHVPGVKPSTVRKHKEWTNYAEFVPQFLKNSITKACLQLKKADFVLCNTVQELECDAISGLNQKLPIYAIGPTNFSSKISTPETLRPATDCMQWLNGKPPRSVLYVSFGSVSPIYKEVMMEIARGVCMSGSYFLFVQRPDQAWNDGPGFDTDRGLVVPWCNQREVLASPAIGGFLTHCGWNSLLESMWFGVPLICHPLYMDQPVNRIRVVDDWKIGINLCDKEPISEEEVAEKIRHFMSSSEELRSEMEKVRKIVHGALGVNGSSDTNLDKFIQDLKGKLQM